MNIKSKNILVNAIISVVTCELFGWYWAFCIYKDASKVTDDYDLIAAIITMLLPSAGFYFLEKSYSVACDKNGIEHTSKAIIYFIIGLIPMLGLIINNAVFQYELNKLSIALSDN